MGDDEQVLVSIPGRSSLRNELLGVLGGALGVTRSHIVTYYKEYLNLNPTRCRGVVGLSGIKKYIINY